MPSIKKSCFSKVIPAYTFVLPLCIRQFERSLVYLHLEHFHLKTGKYRRIPPFLLPRIDISLSFIRNVGGIVTKVF